MSAEKRQAPVKIVRKEKSDQNEHVVNLFFKDLLLEPDKKEEFISKNKDLTQIFNVVDNQNQSIARLSSRNYENIHENFENLGKNIIRFEEKLKGFDKIHNNSSTHHFIVEKEIREKGPEKDEKMEDFKTIPKIEQEISELNIKIEENEKKIVENKIPSDKINKSIPEDEDFIKKIYQERKTIIDGMDENYIIDMTYKNKFIHDYHYELFEILLEQVNKLSFQKVVVDKHSQAFSNMDPGVKEKEIEREKKGLIFEQFKSTCFNAWRFKNQLLCLEGINIVNKGDIDTMKKRLETIREKATELNDPHYEQFFEKVYKLLKVLLFLTVGTKKISSSRTKLKNYLGEIEASRMRIAEYKGKIALLNNIKVKITEDQHAGRNNDSTYYHQIKPQPQQIVLKTSTTFSPQEEAAQLNQEFREFVKELKSLKNTIQMNYNTFLKQLGDQLIKPADLEN